MYLLIDNIIWVDLLLITISYTRINFAFVIDENYCEVRSMNWAEPFERKTSVVL